MQKLNNIILSFVVFVFTLAGFVPEVRAVERCPNRTSLRNISPFNDINIRLEQDRKDRCGTSNQSTIDLEWYALRNEKIRSMKEANRRAGKCPWLPEAEDFIITSIDQICAGTPKYSEDIEDPMQLRDNSGTLMTVTVPDNGTPTEVQRLTWEVRSVSEGHEKVWPLELGYRAENAYKYCPRHEAMCQALIEASVGTDAAKETRVATSRVEQCNNMLREKKVEVFGRGGKEVRVGQRLPVANDKGGVRITCLHGPVRSERLASALPAIQEVVRDDDGLWREVTTREKGKNNWWMVYSLKPVDVADAISRSMDGCRQVNSVTCQLVFATEADRNQHEAAWDKVCRSGVETAFTTYGGARPTGLVTSVVEPSSPHGIRIKVDCGRSHEVIAMDDGTTVTAKKPTDEGGEDARSRDERSESTRATTVTSANTFGLVVQAGPHWSFIRGNELPPFGQLKLGGVLKTSGATFDFLFTVEQGSHLKRYGISPTYFGGEIAVSSNLLPVQDLSEGFYVRGSGGTHDGLTGVVGTQLGAGVQSEYLLDREVGLTVLGAIGLVWDRAKGYRLEGQPITATNWVGPELFLGLVWRPSFLAVGW